MYNGFDKLVMARQPALGGRSLRLVKNPAPLPRFSNKEQIHLQKSKLDSRFRD